MNFEELNLDEANFDPLKLKNLIDELCGSLRVCRDMVPENDRGQLEECLTLLEQNNGEFVAPFQEAKAKYDELLRKAQRPYEPRTPATPAPPPEEDVLALGLACRAELLKRYVQRPSTPPTPADPGDVGDLTTGQFRTEAHEKPTTRPSKPTQPASRPPEDDTGTGWSVD